MDYALVTMRVIEWNWQLDMELPARMRIQDLVPKVLEVLKNYDGTKFFSVSSIELIWNGKHLNSEATLADYQIWDGSMIDIICN